MVAAALTRDSRLLALIRSRLQAFEAVGQEAVAGSHRAAVAVVVADAGFGPDLPGLPQNETWCADAALLLTCRAAGLRKHAGQWALPGGRIDAGESAEQAALRELHEELGLLLDAASVLGRLDDYATRSGFVITPVVMWAGGTRELLPNADEVHSVHRIPAAELLRDDAPILDRIAQSPHPVLRMPVGNAWIAAPTAAVLYQFRELCLLGRPTRVAHFEQPAFAWS